MIKISVGYVLGVSTVIAFLAFGPKGTEQKARVAGKVATAEVSEMRMTYCRKEFLAETGCFQKFPAEECEALIATKCADAPAPKAK